MPTPNDFEGTKRRRSRSPSFFAVAAVCFCWKKGSPILLLLLLRRYSFIVVLLLLLVAVNGFCDLLELILGWVLPLTTNNSIGLWLVWCPLLIVDSQLQYFVPTSNPKSDRKIIKKQSPGYSHARWYGRCYHSTSDSTASRLGAIESAKNDKKNCARRIVRPWPADFVFLHPSSE